MKLGLLELSRDIAEHIEIAPVADALGYSRYWVAEHQPQPSPTLFAAVLAGLTERIRIGTAGILLHYYGPGRAARDFQFLERVYPGRIDAGFCGGMTVLAQLLADEADGRDMAAVQASYEQRSADLVRHLRNVPGSASFDVFTAWEGADDRTPQIWSLGGGARSANIALTLGISFGHALMFAHSRDEPEVALRYRREFIPVGGQAEPLVAVAVAGFCAESDAAARRLADAYPGKNFAPRVVGSARSCADQLAALCDRYRADEVVFTDLSAELERRLDSYRRLAEVGLCYAP